MEPAHRQMCSTNGKDRIFHVRKPYKHTPENISKFKVSPFQEQPLDPKTLQSKKEAMNFPSNASKELRRRYNCLKEELQAQRGSRLKRVKESEQELARCAWEGEKLLAEKARLQERREAIRGKIEALRERNSLLREQELQRNEAIRIMNMEYLRNMVLEMRFQNGVDIDPDRMTYEELLELEEKMGKVSKGLPDEQLSRLTRLEAKGGEGVCSICYCEVKEGEDVNLLACDHCFHVDCLHEWLLKEKLCPLCKQEVVVEKADLQSTQ